MKKKSSSSSGKAPNAAKKRAAAAKDRPHSKASAAAKGWAVGKEKPRKRPGRKVGESNRAAIRERSPEPSNAPRPLNFKNAFATLWQQLFTSPVHLDSALSKAPPSLKGPLAEISKLMLQRPRSLAKYTRIFLNEQEPWGLDQMTLADWPTATVIADRIFQAWKKNPAFHEEGYAFPDDYPIEMTEEWKREYGRDAAKELIQSLAARPPLGVRASRIKGRDTVLSALNDSGDLDQRAKASTLAPYGFYFPDYERILSHPLYKEGAYEIQDEGSQVMALFALWPEHFLPMLRKLPGKSREWPKGKELPEAPSNWIVVDACAGAGGKTLAMADAMLGKGQVFSYDIYAKKLAALRDRATRMGLFNTKTVLLEEGKEETQLKKFAGKADRVLVDSPCSGWGTLRRNPDVKWRQSGESLTRLEKLQTRLLDVYAPLVKKGGILTFGVCTFRKKETTDQVEAFLERHPEFSSVGGGFLGPDPGDGFFFHAFRRNE